MGGREKLSDFKSRKERVFLAIDQDGDCVGETCLGNSNHLVFYMNLEHVRNNWMKISKRVEDMDWGSSEVSVGGSNVGTEAVELFRSPPPHPERERGQGRDGC